MQKNCLHCRALIMYFIIDYTIALQTHYFIPLWLRVIILHFGSLHLLYLGVKDGLNDHFFPQSVTFIFSIPRKFNAFLYCNHGVTKLHGCLSFFSIR